MYVEQIKFERTGGFAGIRLAAEIKLNDLPDEQKREILELLDELDFKELAEKTAGKMPIPDEFVYSVTVKTDKQDYNVLSGESAMPDRMRALIEILERLAKRRARKS